MNKIYKLVWSKVRNTWVVASEIAKGHGKSSSSEGKGNGKLLKSLVLMALLGSFMTAGMSPVAAEETPEQIQAQQLIDAIRNDESLSRQLAASIESSFLGDGNGNIKLPYLGISTNYPYLQDKVAVATGGSSIALGYGSNANTLSVAIGAGSLSKLNASALGYDAKANNFATALGVKSNAAGESSIAIGAGARGYDSPDSATSSSYGSIAIGTNSKVETNSDKAISIGLASKVTSDAAGAVALGVAAKAEGKTSIVIGAEAHTFHGNSIAIGSNTETLFDGTTALGKSAKAYKEGGVALGSYSVAERAKGTQGKNFGDTSVDLTSSTWKSTSGVVAIGGTSSDITRQLTGLAAGSEDSDAVNVAQLKVVNNKAETNKKSITDLTTKVGDNTTNISNLTTKVEGNTNKLTTIEQNITNLTKNAGSGVHYFSVNSDDKNAPDGTNWNNDGATAKDSIAIGKDAVADGIAIGKGAKSTYSSVVIGKGATTLNEENVAIGNNSYSQAEGVAIGTGARSEGPWSVAIGYKVTAKTPYSVAISTGKVDPSGDERHTYTEAVNSSHSTVLGYDSVVGEDNRFGIAIGASALSDKSESGMAIGRIATVINSKHGIALGRQSEVKNSEGGIVVGSLSKVRNSDDALAMGYSSYIDDSQGATVYGHSVNVSESSVQSVAVGYNIGIKNSSMGVAIGTFAGVENAAGAVAIGGVAKGKAVDSVALGSRSVADVAAGEIGYLGDSKTNDATWKSVKGAVSIGDAKEKYTRQITNMAAGTQDTDAVNVAQLKVVNKKADGNARDLADLKPKVKRNSDYINDIHTDIRNLKTTTEKNQKFIQHFGTAPMYFRSGGSKDASGNYTEGKDYWYTTVPTFHVDFGDGLQAEEVVDSKNKKRTLVTVDTDKIIENINSSETKITNVDGSQIDITNNATINNLKGGFTLKDTNNGTADVTLGDTKKPAITFKAETKNDEGAASALTATVDDQKNVTYTLNTKKLKEEMGLTQGVGSMSSWNLTATGDTKSEAIADGNTVEFAVETADKGLTVKREGKKIQYGINADKLVENINSATTKITNVDGDNIDLSKNTSITTINENITKMAAKATKVTVNSKDDNSDDANANLKIKKTEKDGQLTYDLSLNDEITIGKDGKDGKIGINGKDGKSADITVGKGKDGVDGTNGKDGITRIIYTDKKDNKTHEVATLDDGLKFKGDSGDVVIRKLNTQLDIKGGAKAEDLSDGNIGVVGTAGDQGGMAVKLSKKLKGLTSAEFVDGDNITNITGGNISITKTVEGNKTTKNIDLWDLSTTVEGNTTNISNLTTTVNNFKGGFTIKDTNNGTANVALGDTNKPAITFKAETKNDEGAASALTATVDDQKNVTYTLNTKKLKEEMGLTQGVGSMSSWNLTATGDTKSEAIADGNTVEFAVETADKGLTVKREGKKIQYGINADKLIENINSATTKITNVDGDNIDLSKNTSITTINENITKMAAKATKVTVNGKDDNSDVADASLKITKKTVEGQTTYDLSLNDKITIGKDGKDGKIGINGKDGKSADITVGKGEDGVDGTNGKDGITRIIYTDKGGKTHEVATLDDGLKFKGDNNDVVIRKLNTQLNITGGAAAADLSDNNIGVVGTAGDNGGLAVKLSKKLTGLTSAQFVDGDNITNITGGNISITKKVNNENKTKNIDLWDLSETVNTGAKATKVTVNSKEDNSDNADASLKITKKTVDGQTTYDLSLNDKITIGKDGKDGKIGINGKDGKSADITVGKGEDGVDGKAGQDGITRIIYTDKGGKTHEVATLDDGLKFKGDNNDVVIRKLNTQLNITGGAAAADLSDNNIGVVGTAGDNGGLAVKLSKKLTGLTSAQFVDGDNITNITGGNISITKKVDGNKTTKNIDLWELNETVNNITAGTTGGSWKLQANGKNERTIAKDGIVNFKNGKNTEVTVNENDITVDLNEATKKQITDNTTKIKNIGDRVTNIETNIETKIEQKMEGSKIKVEGDPTTGVKATEVKTGDKVTGYKVSLDKKVQVGKVTVDGDSKGEITGLTNTTINAADFATKGRAATEEQLKAAVENVKVQSRTTVKGSDNIKVTPKTTSAAEYTVELAKDISVDNVTVKDKITAKTVNAGEKVTVGDTVTIDKNGLTIKDGPSVTKDGINAGGKKVTGVAPGDISKDSKDVVTGGQLFATNQQVVSNMSQINSLRDESREGDALGSAMAALKPLDFDPYQRSQVMAGVGYYKGREAVALGLAHYKNEDLMFHGGIAYAGSSELMANVGVSYRFGSSEDKEAQKARNLRMPQYDKGPISSVYILQDEVERLTKENKEANDRIAALEAKLEKVLEKVK